jgi:hypothetical protein
MRQFYKTLLRYDGQHPLICGHLAVARLYFRSVVANQPAAMRPDVDCAAVTTVMVSTLIGSAWTRNIEKKLLQISA